MFSVDENVLSLSFSLSLEVGRLVVGDPHEGHAAVQLEDEDVEEVLRVLPLVVSVNVDLEE